MNITTTSLGNVLLDALDAFDVATLPLGLYACEEFQAKDRPFVRLHQEWYLCIKPCLESLGCTSTWENVRNGHFSFILPDRTHVDLRAVRTSKIKVRKFGSAYRIEPHQKFEERWQEQGAEYQTRSWADRENRNFFVRTSIWSRPNI